MTALAEQRLYDIVRHRWRNPPDLAPTTRFREDLGADSLDLVELVYEFEQEFGVAITEAQAADVRTLADAVALVGAAT